ncbi:transglutaminase [Neobacillus notoginsengisoli]|uniref:Transglutaminase n=1 Tax=Neobacillus notoginsengisoli TaxID=1578198 RepID=A0A417YFI2_9BACI|nr:DUF3488 and transglutaminase-like domain-containing protein [Neobacillus notoginsengisoli]RHW31476.1 transglutaminase [Neobacillus notoginsengisoli]
MSTNKEKFNFSSILLYLIGFLLIWEWLRPMGELTDTENIEVFLIFLVIAFAAALFQLPMVVQAFIKTFYIFYAVYRFYFEGGFLRPEWLGLFFSDVKYNLGLLLGRDFQQFTNVFRTVLFFLLLWLMVYLIQYWLLNRRKIFVFFLMTIIYISVLDTFTTFKGNGSIIRTVVLGFTVMGILTYLRLVAEGKLRGDGTLAGKWMLPLAGMVIFSAAVGLAAPKAAPIWPDPVPFLKSFNENSGSGGTGGIARIGYGTNDSRLGGPFLPDDTVVFRADSESRQYWRVETKDVYTGKGWILSDQVKGGEGFSQDDPFPLGGFPPNVKTEEQAAKVYIEFKYPHIVYPQGTKKVAARYGVSFLYNPVSEKIRPMEPWNEPAELDDYGFIYDVPAYKMDDLKWADGTDLAEMPEDFFERFTQLPPSLPDRVRDLAAEITKDKLNWYEKAKAVESYFASSEFTYDQKNVAVPDKNQDYVDQFLFDTKTGYCDNFSTSMVTMLRSIGIPARWVKGYTYGEAKSFGDGDSKKRLYEVTNNDAHSWVEVYLPNLGWLPFEPTKGFSNSIQIDIDRDTDSSGKTPAATPDKKDSNPQDRLNRLEENDPIPQQLKANKSPLEKARIFMKNEWKWLAACLAIIVAVGWFIYSKRGRWLPYYLIYRYKFSKNDDQFGKAYLTLLEQLKRFGLKRDEGQTLRNYAGYIDRFFATKEMGKLTARYEQFLYRKELPEGTWLETKQLWENLIKKTIS